MGKTRSDIIGDIEDYIARNGARFGEWFVGTTALPKVALFQKHAVRQKGDAWIARLAKDEYEAKDIAEYFLTSRQTQGRGSRGGDTEVYIYAYKMKSHTKP